MTSTTAPRLLLLLLSPLAFAACFDGDSKGVTDATASTTEPTTGAIAQTSGTTADVETTAGTTTWTSTTGPDPVTTTTTTGEPWTTGTTWPDATATSTTTGEPDAGCSMYCTALMSSCTGEHSQYPSIESCEGACAGLPPGSPGVTSGNSLACRAYHAGMASIDPTLHCVHAGPGGAGACGQNCEGFCAIATSICPTEYPDVDGCLASCAGFADTEPYDINDVSGDTLACRLYHLTIAATSDGDSQVHCPHTIAVSPVCI